MRRGGSDMHREEDAYWDAVVRGQQAPPAIDPDLAAGIAFTHAADDATGPDPVFIDHLLEDLMHTATSAVSSSPFAILGHSSPNGRVLDVLPPERSPRRHATSAHGASARRFGVGYLALAAVALLLLAGSFAAIARNELSGSRQPGGYIAAVDPVTPTPQPGIGGQVLITAQLAAEWLPGDRPVVSFYLATFDAGATAEHPAGSLPKGMRLDYVVAGSYTIRSEGQLVVLRGDAAAGTPSASESAITAQPETVEPGVEVTLRAGDAVIITDLAAAHTITNAGSELALVIAGSLLEMSPPGPPMNASDIQQLEETTASLAGPLTVTLRQVRLELDGKIPGTETGVQVSGADPRSSDESRLAKGSGGSISNRGNGPVDVWVLTIEPQATSTPVADVSG